MDLRETKFEGARLTHGILHCSDLTNANLANTDLSNASLKQANLTGTVFRNAIVNGANFTGVKGLTAEVTNYLKSKGATGL
ncbi:MAG: pentapeptide repeat-containing protein [Candidatus Binatia bacterium]